MLLKHPGPLFSMMLLGCGSSGGGAALSNDTSLSVFTIDSEAVEDTDTIQRGNGVTEVDVIATPTHVGASRTINGSATANPVAMALATGDNTCTVHVTAEDGVTTQDHVVTVRRLTAGAIERTQIGVISDGGVWQTGAVGLYFSIYAADGRHDFWGNTGTETPPSSPGVLHEVLFNSTDTTAVIAAAFHAAMTALLFTDVSIASNILTVDDLIAGARTDATAETAPVSVFIVTQGVDPS